MEAYGPTVVVRCGSCGGDNWLPAAPFHPGELPACSTCGQPLIVPGWS